MSPPPSVDPPLPPEGSPEPLRAAVRAPAPYDSPYAARPAPRILRWRAAWQLPLLWGVPATLATVSTLLHGKNIKSLVPLMGAGMGLPVYFGLRQWHAILIVGLVCGLAIFAVIGALYDVLVRYRAGEDSWWDRNWTLFLAVCLIALVVSQKNSYTFEGWCFAYGVGVMFLAVIMVGVALIWGVCRLGLLIIVRSGNP